jgi:hypothetical protein
MSQNTSGHKSEKMSENAPDQIAGKPSPQPLRKNTKRTGERSEAAFLHRASSLGFGVARPWGDSLRYDFILDNGSCLWRVQVKCTESIRADAYETRATYSVGAGRAVYTRADIDFLAAHVVPLDIWYILPVEICTPQPMLRFYPHREAKKMRLEPYREAWHLLQSQSPESPRALDIHAAAEAAYPEESSAVTRDVSTAHVGTAALGCPAGQSPGASETLPRLTWLTLRPRRS